MNKMILLFILIFIVAVCLAILIINIELERAQQALAIVIAAAVAVTIFVFLKSETIDISFPCDFFFDKETSSPLFFTDIFAYRRRNLGATIWSKFTERKDWREELKKLGDGITQQKAIARNLFEAILLEKMSSLYYHHWNIKAHSWRTAVSYSGRISPETDNMSNVKIYTKSELQKIFRDNIFINDILFLTDKLVLPKGTKLIVERDNKNMTTLVQFKHKIFEVSIEFSGNFHYSVGLGSLGGVLKISPEEAQKRYASLETDIIFKAKFNRWFSGSSKMKQYMRWIKQMFKILRDDFDGELLWKEIQDELLFEHAIETKKD